MLGCGFELEDDFRLCFGDGGLMLAGKIGVWAIGYVNSIVVFSYTVRAKGKREIFGCFCD